ncbi:PilZ domain-containing protein [Sulfurospirillum sp. 1307]
MGANESLKVLSTIKILHVVTNSPVIPISNIKNNFLKYECCNINDSNLEKKSADILFIEFPTLKKDEFVLLNEIVKKNTNKEIYIFTKETENVILLKFALHFSINKLHSIKIQEKEFISLCLLASKKTLIKKEEKHQIEISKKINSLFALLIFKSKKLTFANERAKSIFPNKTLKEIESLILNNEDIYKLLVDDETKKIDVIMQNENGENWSYEFFLDTLSSNDDKLLTIVPQGEVQNDEGYLSTVSRFKFIEILKDRLAQNSVNEVSMSIIGINISNYDKLLKNCGSIVMHDFIKKFIDKLCFYKDTCQELSQWEQHFFVFLVEGKSFEEVKEELDSIHQKIIYSEVDANISPIITSTALNIDKFDINEIIESLEHISSRSYSENYFNSCDFFEINHLDDCIDENDQIKYYLKTCIANKTPIKLLNIYKGLCINTSSKIIKEKDDSYFVHCESIQGYSMQFENKSVIQAPDLPKDLEADVIYVNIEKSYAVLDNLRFLETSANNRKTTRVQPSIRTPINVMFEKSSFQGMILDISTQAIAIILNHSLSSETKNKKVKLRFKFPNESSENGFVIMDIEGNVMFVQEVGQTKTKLVVGLELEQPYDSYLLKYMYDRQKELILELKRAVKVHNVK